LINVDAVPPKLRGTRAFRDQCAEMIRKLQNPDFVRFVCAHEAAHLIFFEMMGPIAYRPLRPFLMTDPKESRFQACFAAIELLDFPPCFEHQWAEWLGMWADAEAAGGVVGRRLLPAEPRGDNGDRQNFTVTCRQIEEHFEDRVKIDAEKSWRNAQERVELRLTDDPRLLQRIFQRADKIRSEFGFRQVATGGTNVQADSMKACIPVFVPSFQLIS